jgi:hypothetical protein
MFNRKKISELEERIFKLENPNGRVLCLAQKGNNPYNPYKKCDLIFEYKSNKSIKLDSGYYGIVSYTIERTSNEVYKIKIVLEHCLVVSCRTVDYYLVNTSTNSVIQVDKDMKVVL